MLLFLLHSLVLLKINARVHIFNHRTVHYGVNAVKKRHMASIYLKSLSEGSEGGYSAPAYFVEEGVFSPVKDKKTAPVRSCRMHFDECCLT